MWESMIYPNPLLMWGPLIYPGPCYNDDEQDAWDTICNMKTGKNEKKNEVLIDLVLLPAGTWQQRLLDVIV